MGAGDAPWSDVERFVPVRQSAQGADQRGLGGRLNPGSPGASSPRLW